MRAAVAAVEREHGQHRRARQQRRVQPVGRGRGSADRARAQAVRDQRLRPAAPDAARAARHARARTAGRIVNIGSMGGRLTFPGGGVYHATKHALGRAERRAAFRGAGFGIEVVLIEPGLIRSGFARRGPREPRSSRARRRARTRTSPARSAGSRPRATRKAPSRGSPARQRTSRPSVERGADDGAPENAVSVSPSARFFLALRALALAIAVGRASCAGRIRRLAEPDDEIDAGPLKFRPTARPSLGTDRTGT